MTETTTATGSKIAAGYGARAMEFTAASAGLAHEKGRHAATLAAAYSAFAAGYVAAAAAAEQAGTAAPFPLLPLPDTPAIVSPLDVLTLAQAADYLHLSEEAIRAEAEAGRIAGREIDHEWRFLRDSLMQWLRNPRQPARPSLKDLPVSDETPEEHEAFMANIRAFRDEIDRATGSGKYAPE